MTLFKACPPPLVLLQVEAAKEARLKGPQSFSLQRLLTCLSYLHSGREVAEMDRMQGPSAAPATEGGPGEDNDSDSDDDGDGLLRLDLMLEGREEEDGRPDLNKKPSSKASKKTGEGGGVGSDGGGHAGRWGRQALGREAPWWRRRAAASEAAAGGSDPAAGKLKLGGHRTAMGCRSEVEGADVMSHLSTLASMQLLSKVRLQVLQLDNNGVPLCMRGKVCFLPAFLLASERKHCCSSIPGCRQRERPPTPWTVPSTCAMLERSMQLASLTVSA